MKKFSGDQKLLLALGVLIPVFLGLALLFAPDDDLDDADVSTYSARSGGAKATFELIHELGYEVDRWEHPISDLDGDEDGTLLIVSTPRRALGKSNREALQRFVDHGGTALITGYTAGDLVPPDRYAFNIPTQSWHRYSPGQPHAMNRGVHAITMPEMLTWRIHPEDVPLFAKDDRAVAVTFTRGKGRVIWLASHIPLCNAGLKAEGNPEFLATVLHAINPEQVYWYAEGSQTGAGDRSALTSTPALAAYAQVLFIFGLVLWTHARRSGPVHPLAENTAPIAQLEFVHTLGSLYDHANATNIAVDIAYRRFVFVVSRHFGIPNDDNLRERLSSAVARSLSLPQAEVADLFATCDRAIHTPNLPRNEAARYVNKLRDYLVGLKLISAGTQEKH